MNKQDYDDKIKNISKIFKALSNETRLCIITKLSKCELNVSQMQDCLLMPQSTISQHLSILRMGGIVEGERKGSEVVYKLVDEEVKDIIELFFKKNDIPV